MRTVKKKTVLFTLGTRPEAIKLAPVIRAFQAEPAFTTRLCVTAQHRKLVDEVLEFFGIRPDFDLNVMLPGQTLAAMTSRIVAGCEEVFGQCRPDLLFVQGDTTSAFAAAVAASQCKIPVAHVEAGLRSHRKDSPFPEEINRVMIGHLATLHFAPGKMAVENLRCEGITQNVHVVGNPVVDTLTLALQAQTSGPDTALSSQVPSLSPKRKIVLVTLHRRESFGRPLVDICAAIRAVAETCEGVEIIFPVHPNPSVHRLVHQTLAGIDNVHLLEPLSYANFIRLLCRASLIISDSGGVLEEAETLGLPVLVTREVTERVEALALGNAILVGSDKHRIIAEATHFLSKNSAWSKAAPVLRHTFGDGHTSARILRLTCQYFEMHPKADLSTRLPFLSAA